MDYRNILRDSLGNCGALAFLYLLNFQQRIVPPQHPNLSTAIDRRARDVDFTHVELLQASATDVAQNAAHHGDRPYVKQGNRQIVPGRREVSTSTTTQGSIFQDRSS